MNLTTIYLMHKASLIHLTPEAEQLIAYLARVSNKDAKPGDPSDKLIRYLIKHQHWSPFEMVNMCVQIDTTRSISAQILRHRSFSFQEFSQRYAAVTSKPGPLEVRRQDTTNRQNSIDDIDEYTSQDFQIKAEQVYNLAYNLYDEMLKAGVAKECAREVLPLSSPTKLYMNGTIRSWIHYCKLRCSNGTQLEHKQIADQIKDIIKKQLPGIYKAAFNDNLN